MIRQHWALAIALAIAAEPSFAGVGGEIAYSLRGGREIYLINPDGSGRRLVYRAPGRKTVLALDVKPDGGQVTFEEVDADGQTATLKSVTYGASGLGVVVLEIPGCRLQSDTAEDGGLLYVDSCDRDLMYIAAGTSTAVNVNVPADVVKVAWLADGSFLYATTNAQVRHGTLGSPSGTQVASQDCVQTLNGAHGSNEALIGVGSFCGQAIKRLQVATSTLSSSLADGISPSYSPDDSCFIYLASAGRANILTIQRIDGLGTPVQLGRKANYASVDWRGDSSPDACPVSSSALEFRTPPIN